MFMRSENLLLRPIWPEDRDRIAAMAIPDDHPMRVGHLLASFVVLQPDAAEDRIVGVAGWTWEGRPVSWIPRADDIVREANESLNAMMAPLPRSAIQAAVKTARIAA